MSESSGRRRGLFITTMVLQGLGIAGSAVLARAGAPPSTILLVLAASFVPYAGTLWAVPDALGSDRTTRAALAGLFAFGLVLVAAPPTFSDDRSPST